MAEQKVFSSSSIEDNKKFLDYFDFKDTGCYYTYNNGKLEFYRKNGELQFGEAGIFCFCVDGCIAHIGSNSNILKILSSSYRTGGTRTIKENDKKKQGTDTYDRVNSYLKKMEEAVSKQVSIYYKLTKSDEDRMDIKYRIIYLYINAFKKYIPLNTDRDNEKAIKRNVGIADFYLKDFIKFCNSKVGNALKDFEHASMNVRKEIKIQDRLEEVKSNQIINCSTSRSNEVRKMALLHANNKCFLEDSEHCEQAYFKRKNIIVEGNDNYLEVHHLIPLWLVNSQNDETKQQLLHNSDLDIEANTVCLCSNCHNKLHYGTKSEVERLLKNLYDRKKNELEKEHLFITFDDLLKTYIEDY